MVRDIEQGGRNEGDVKDWVELAIGLPCFRENAEMGNEER